MTMVSQELQGDYMSRPNKKLEKYISLNEKIKKLTKEKDQLRSKLIDGVGIIVQGADIIVQDSNRQREDNTLSRYGSILMEKYELHRVREEICHVIFNQNSLLVFKVMVKITPSSLTIHPPFDCRTMCHSLCPR